MVRPRAQNVDRVPHMLAALMDKKRKKEIVEVNCCISEPQTHSMAITLGATQERILHYVCRPRDASLIYTQMLSVLPRKGGPAFLD
jgi:hypothetical protein